MQTYLKFADISKFPHRNDLLDQKLTAETQKRIAENNHLYFMPNTVQETTEYDPTRNINIYKIYVFGVLPDGSKTLVILAGVPVYFDARVEDTEKAPELMAKFGEIFQRKGIKYTSAEIVKGFRQNEFRPAPDDWIRFHFNNLKDRSQCIKYVQEMERPGFVGTPDGYKEKRRTASDDNGGFIHNYYFPKVAREQLFNTCNWNIIHHWVARDTKSFPNIRYCFELNYANYIPADNYIAAMNPTPTWVRRDPIIIATYDIETYTRSNATGEAPKPTDDNYNIFMICMTFHYHHSVDALLRVCICDVPMSNTTDIFFDRDELNAEVNAEIHKNKLTATITDEETQAIRTKCMKKRSACDVIIECGDQRSIMRAYIHVLSSISPDIMVAFNCGNFDNPIIRETLAREHLLLEFRDRVGCIARQNWEIDKETAYDIDPETGAKIKIADVEGIATNESRVYKYSWATENVKISAEESLAVLRLDVPGILDTDCMIVFKKLYPRNEIGNKYGLNYFLSINKLPSKIDLPYKTMFKYYEAAIRYNKTVIEGIAATVEESMITKLLELGQTPEQITQTITDQKHKIVERKFSEYMVTPAYINGRASIDAAMAEVAKYCIIDAFSCQRLYTTRLIVSDKREVSNASFVTLFAGFYRADGMKVRNIVGSECYHNRSLGYPVMFSNAHPSNTKIKYPGAWVFPPKKGLNVRRPVVGLDFASLYPSLMMTYNLSPEKSIEEIGTNPDPNASQKIRDLTAAGYHVHRIDFTAEITDENAPNCGSTIQVGGWTIRHSNVLKPGDKVDHVVGGEPCPRQGQEPMRGETMGIFPTILIRLFNDRRVLKKRFVALEHLIEHMNNIRIEHEVMGIPNDWSTVNLKDLQAAGFTKEQLMSQPDTFLDDIKFTCNIINSKQGAKKIFMNTFYGEQGNYLSSIYKLLIAGAITSAGQENIKLVNNKLLSMGYSPSYGDTDSDYISAPESLFVRIDKSYNDLTEQLRSTMTPIPYDNIDISIRNAVVDKLKGTLATYRNTYKANESKYKSNTLSLEEFTNISHNEFESLARFVSGCIDEIVATIATTSSASTTSSVSTSTSTNVIATTTPVRSIDRCVAKCLFMIIKEEYWTTMVQITRRDLTNLVQFINKFLRDTNGTKYLAMDYEEVLFPVFFTGKKKYFGFAHLAEENFHPADNKIFIKGIDIIKQGQSELAKNVGMKIIRTVCSVYNESSVVDIIKRTIRYIYDTKWEIKHFILNAKYKPNKHNVPIMTFVDRMKEQHIKYLEQDKPWYNPEKSALYMPPEPGDPFQYVVVRRNQSFDLRGRKIELKKGDKMEYLRVYNAALAAGDTMEIDLNYYMEGAIMGLFARFIVYMDEFSAPDNLDDEEADKYSLKLANKYIEDYCNECAGINKADIRSQGRSYQRLSKFIDKKINELTMTRLSHSVHTVLHRMNIPEVMYVDKKSTRYNDKLRKEAIDVMYTRVLEFIQSIVNADVCKQRAHEFIASIQPTLTTDPSYIYDLHAEYKVRIVNEKIDPNSRLGILDSKIEQRKQEISDMCEQVIEIIQTRRYKIADLINDMRSDIRSDDADGQFDLGGNDDLALIARINAINDLSNEQYECINKFYDLVVGTSTLLEERLYMRTVHSMIAPMVK